MAAIFLACVSSLALAQDSGPERNEPLPRSSGQPPKGRSNRQTERAPTQTRNAEESSSRDTLIDLSPPKDDAKNHPDSGFDDDSDETGISEFKPYDPHRAAKSIEVGDYYAKQKNYRAAISRYREALQYKPRDAEATLRLASALEKTGDSAEALAQYQSYLKILPNGPLSDEVRKAVTRLGVSGDNARPISPPERTPR